MATSKTYDDALDILSVLERGVVQGTLPGTTERTANTTAFNTAIAECISAGRKLWVPPGRYEIYGAIIINGSYFRWDGTLGAVIVQYNLGAPVIHVGPPLGTAGTATEGIVIDGVTLKYSGTATGTATSTSSVAATVTASEVGGNALELTGVWMSSFANIDIGDVNANLAGRVSVPWRGILCDGTPGTVPPFSNTWNRIRIKHFGYRGIDAPRPAYDGASTGSVWINTYLSCGDGDGQGDLTANGGCGVYFQMQKQLNLQTFNVEWMKAPSLMVLDNCIQAEVTGFNLEGTSVKLAASGDAGFIDMINSKGAFRGFTTLASSVLTANNIANAALFRLYDGSYVEVGDISIENTIKTTAPGTPPFSLFRHMTGGTGNQNVRISLSGEISFNSNHNVQAFDTFLLSTAGAGQSIYTELIGLNNSTPYSVPHASTGTHYTAGTCGVLVLAPTANRSITLSNLTAAGSGIIIPRGTRRTIAHSTGVFTITVLNHNGSTVRALPTTINTAYDFVFDGTNWIHVG